MSDFERTKQDVAGRSILITSWYDDGTQNWRASAPIYAYTNLFAPTPPVICPSRQVAIKRVCDLLSNYLEKQSLPR